MNSAQRGQTVSSLSLLHNNSICGSGSLKQDLTVSFIKKECLKSKFKSVSVSATKVWSVFLKWRAWKLKVLLPIQVQGTSKEWKVKPLNWNLTWKKVSDFRQIQIFRTCWTLMQHFGEKIDNLKSSRLFCIMAQIWTITSQRKAYIKGVVHETFIWPELPDWAVFLCNWKVLILTF